MLQIITNPVFVAVIVMTVLCLLKMNVYLSIIIAALVCGLMGGSSIYETLELFFTGTGNDLGGYINMLFMSVVAAYMVSSGLGDVLAPRVSKALRGKPWILVVAFAVIGICCETVLTFGSSFCLIIIPPLLAVFNNYKVDRRKVCTSIMCGLQIGYACVPIGFGALFMGIVAAAMADNGVAGITYLDVAKANWPIILAMVLAIVFVCLVFRKPREYKPVAGITAPAEGEAPAEDAPMPKWEVKHTLAIIAALVAPAVQMLTGYLQLGGLISMALFVIFGIVKFGDMRKLTDTGFLDIAVVVFIMMAGGGFANVSRTVGNVDALVANTVSLIGSSKLLAAFIMLLLGLLVTLGIGTSWGTVPIVATIMVPMGLQLGFSIPAIIMLISAAAVLGDAGSPASDQTLLPTAVFNLDGQHDHIWDTCVPSFICCNVPILIICSICACIM